MTAITSLDELLNLAKTDTNFREQLLVNPKEALATKGAQLPEGVDIEVIDQTDGKVYLVIPTSEQVQQSELSAEDPIGKLILRASADESLRAELLANPKGVIARETGLNIPEEVEVSLLQTSANKAYLVLPKVETEGDKELSEHELESVAGGATPTVAMFVGGALLGFGLAAAGDWLRRR